MKNFEFFMTKVCLVEKICIESTNFFVLSVYYAFFILTLPNFCQKIPYFSLQ